MNEHISREFLLAFWKIHILHHAAERPVYGLWMLEELAEHGHKLSPGTLYPMLQRMEERGWLRSESGELAKSRRNYRITSEGRAVLRELRGHLRELYSEVVGEPSQTRPSRGRRR